MPVRLSACQNLLNQYVFRKHRNISCSLYYKAIRLKVRTESVDGRLWYHTFCHISFITFLFALWGLLHNSFTRSTNPVLLERLDTDGSEIRGHCMCDVSWDLSKSPIAKLYESKNGVAKLSITLGISIWSSRHMHRSGFLWNWNISTYLLNLNHWTRTFARYCKICYIIGVKLY